MGSEVPPQRPLHSTNSAHASSSESPTRIKSNEQRPYVSELLAEPGQQPALPRHPFVRLMQRLAGWLPMNWPLRPTIFCQKNPSRMGVPVVRGGIHIWADGAAMALALHTLTTSFSPRLPIPGRQGIV